MEVMFRSQPSGVTSVTLFSDGVTLMQLRFATIRDAHRWVFAMQQASPSTDTGVSAIDPHAGIPSEFGEDVYRTDNSSLRLSGDGDGTSISSISTRSGSTVSFEDDIRKLRENEVDMSRASRVPQAGYHIVGRATRGAATWAPSVPRATGDTAVGDGDGDGTSISSISTRSGSTVSFEDDIRKLRENEVDMSRASRVP